MKKLLRRILLGLVVVLVALVLARNFIARVAVEIGVKKVTGFPLTIGSVNVGLFNGQLDVRDLQLMNPQPYFPDKMFVDLPQFHLDYRVGSMLAVAPHINDMQIDIQQIAIVKNAQGESNVQRLKGVTASSGGAKSSPSDQSASGKKMPYRVDVLRIHIGTVTIKDYSKAKPTERKLNLNIDATYKDITDSTDITRLVLMTMLSQARLPDIGVNMDDLKKGLGTVTNTAGKALSGATEAVGKAGQGLFDTLKKVVPQP